MAVAALAVVPPARPGASPPERRTPGEMEINIAAAVPGLRDLDVTVRIGTLPDERLALWSAATRTLVVRPDATLQQTLWVLHDLHELAATPGHESPSRVDRHLQVVQ